MLTDKQEKYVRNLVYENMSQRKAYRDAYPASQKWQDNTVDSRASELLKNSKVLGRYLELKDEITKEKKENAIWNFDKSVNELLWLIEQSKTDLIEYGFRQANSTAFINAVKELNDLLGIGAERESKLEVNKAKVDKIKTETDKLKGISEEIENLSDVLGVIYDED